MTIEGQDLRMAYMDVPASGAPNGRTVVLMHGKNFGGYYWANVIAFLTSSGYRVVVPDQIGWGKSSKPEIRYSFHLLAANTVQLLDKLGIGRVVVIGHSTGGMLAVRFALSYPDRVSQLVLEGPLGMEDYRAIPRSTDEELYRQEMSADPEKIRAAFRRYFADPRVDLYAPLAEVPIRVIASGEYPRLAKASALAYQMIYEQPVRYEYPKLKPPVLIIVGDKDHTVPLSSKAPPALRETMGRFPELARQAAKDIPNGTAVVVPDCGHIPHIEKP
jgi:pimeloyl-ACP methyl ester carboxylesterase